jgi:hypothetical protein
VDNLFDNMHPEELAFFAYMGEAPSSEVAAFRVGMNALMSCFGGSPVGSLLLLHARLDVEELTVHSFNVPTEEVRGLLTVVLDNVISTETNATGVEH